MSKSPVPAWWSRLRAQRRNEATARDVDFADMGTAFGLDASFAAAMDPEPTTAPGEAKESSHLNDRLNGRSAF